MTSRLTRTEVRELLDRHDLSPSRALGQNFLCEPTTIDKIVRLAKINAGDRVVEIGPGLGSLTVGLLTAGATVLAVEIDQYLLPALREVTDGGAITIVHGDALRLDWPEHLSADDAIPSRVVPSWKVVANLPYNVATPLILDLLRSRPEFMSWLVMVQREVGERLVAGPGSRTYGIPSVLTAYWGTAQIAGTISAEVFHPKPKVESVLVSIDRASTPNVDADFEELAKLVRAGFGQRRKMVRRSLSAYLDVAAIEQSDVAPTDRAEQLDLAAWGRLARTAAAASAASEEHASVEK